MKTSRISATLLFFAFCTFGFAQSLPKLKPLKEKQLLEVISPLEKKGKWGFANTKGKFIIKNVFDAVAPFDGNTARVRIGNKWGLLSNNGTFILEPQYDEISAFGNNPYALVRLDGKYGTINREGAELVPPQYDFIGSVKGFNPILVERDKLIGTLSPDGTIGLQPTYYDLGEYNGRYAFAHSRGKVGTVDADLTPIIPTEYTSITPFVRDVFKVDDGEHQGLFTESGKVVLAPEYEKLTPATGNFIITENFGKYGIATLRSDNTVNLLLKPVLTDEPQLDALPAVFFHDKKLSIITADSNTEYNIPADVAADVATYLPLPADEDILTRHSLGAHTLYALNHRPVYLLDDNYSCIWAVTSQYKDYAESPVSNDITFKNYKREMKFKANTEYGTVYETFTLDTDWPEALADKRADLRHLQYEIGKRLSDFCDLYDYEETGDYTIYIAEEEGVDYRKKIEDCVFAPHDKTVVKSIPSSADYSENFAFSLELKSVPSQVDGCILFGYGTFAYLGGAHGSYSINWQYYNLATGNPVRLSDLFTYSQRQKMLSIMTTRPVDEYGDVPDSDDINYDTLDELPDNFIIKDGYIYFQFQPYEIAAYAYGAPLLGVRLSEIR